MENPLIALSNELASLAERAGKDVVAVHGRPRVSSSGVVWRSGVIVTVEHALRRGEEVRVTFPDGRASTAELAGRDPGTDLAVLKVESTGAPALANEKQPLRPGYVALAVGRSAEAGVNAAMGVISSVAGPWHTWRGGRIDQRLRLDIGLHPAASGAIVIGASGERIGIATPAFSRTSIFAIPAATIERVTTELLDKGHIARGYLGVGLQPIVLPEHLRSLGPTPNNTAGGLIVLSVEKDGPAGRAGVVLGDVLVALDEKRVTDTDDVQAFLSANPIGTAVRATVLRGGAVTQFTIQIGERPRREA